jgi:hypothetical protein
MPTEAVLAFSRDQSLNPVTFNPTIDPRDEMYGFAVRNLKGNVDRATIRYLAQGRRIFDNVRQLLEWRFGSTAQCPSFVDFAAGFGRLTRYLVQAMPVDRVFTTEINASAVHFQREQFGVTAVQSYFEPEKFKADQTFACVYAGSLFTHLPERRQVPWLVKLLELVDVTDGMLVVSYLDESALDPNVVVGPKGFIFGQQSEIPALSSSEYGHCWASEGFVRASINRAAVTAGWPTPVIHRIPRGLCGHQDLYVVTRPDQRSTVAPMFHHSPDGQIHLRRQYADGAVLLTGWSRDLNAPGGRIEVVTVPERAGDVQYDLATPPSAPTPGIQTFRLTLDAQIPTDQPVLIKLRQPDGLERALDCDTREKLGAGT